LAVGAQARGSDGAIESDERVRVAQRVVGVHGGRRPPARRPLLERGRTCKPLTISRRYFRRLIEEAPS
jgi:hypothetical protein